MYSTQAYLYDQIHWVVLGIGPIDRYNRMFYTKTIKLFKGIDNHVKFRIRNQNQKDVNVGASTFQLYIMDPAGNVQLYTRMLSLDDPQHGLIKTTIPEEDLRNLEPKLYHYSLRMIDGEGVEHPVYVDDNYSAAGVMDLADNAYPTAVPAVTATIGAYNNNVAYSSQINLSESSTGHHTVAYYLADFTGTITVEGRVDQSLNTPFGDVGAIVITNTYAGATRIYPVNFTGMFTSIRFKIERTSGTVTKILYKN